MSWFDFASFMSPVLLMAGAVTWLLGALADSDFTCYLGLAIVIAGLIFYLAVWLYIKVKGYRIIYCGKYDPYFITVNGAKGNE